MQDIATKIEGSQLTAEEFNQIPAELENVITSTGQTLTNSDLRQLVKAISIYTGKGDFYNTSGTANNIILNPIDNIQTPIAYNDGLRVRFIASATNTNSVTINILGLTSCELLNAAGSSLAAGELVINKEYSATYLDGKFRLFASDTSKVNLNLGNSTAITNCIIEIPQDIKLELNDGTLTLKAGSKVYVPNGVGVFDEVVTSRDIVVTGYGTGVRQLFVFVKKEGGGLDTTTLISSGSDSSSVTGMFYNTATNTIDYYSSGTPRGALYALPLCIITMTGSTITSIDQVFNGFGYMGSTMFALPGVKGLIPNGRNADGSLKNIEFVSSQVLTRTFDISFEGVLGFNGVYIDTLNKNFYSFDYKNNYVMNQNLVWKFAIIGTFTLTNGVISNFQSKLPFRAVDYNDVVDSNDTSDNSTKIVTTAWLNNSLKNILIPSVGSKVDIVTAVSSTDGYTAPSSGFVSVQTNVNGATTTLSVDEVVVAQAFQYSGDSHGNESKQLFTLVGKGQVVKTNRTVQFGVFVPFK